MREVIRQPYGFYPTRWSPRRIVAAAGELRAGINRLRIRVYTSLIRPFEGVG